MWALVRRLLTVSVAAGALACSADEVEPPEPTIETLGAFVAREEQDQVRLYRTVGWLRLQDGDTVLEMIVYEPELASFEDAVLTAKRRDPPLEGESATFLRSFFDLRPWRVVWFRSLHDDEPGFL